MILPIINNECWELMCQKNQAQINYDNNHDNKKIVDYNYKVSNRVILKNKSAYKYENPYKWPYVITQTWNNCTVTLQIVAMKNIVIICWIKAHITKQDV